MSSHMRGRGRGVGGHRGGGGGYPRGRGNSSMRPPGFAPRSRGGGYGDRNRDSFPPRSMSHHRSNSSSHSHMKSDRFIPNLGARAHFELTKALVASALKSVDHSERRGRYTEERDSDYGMKRYRREGRGSHMRDEPRGRSMRQRPFSDRPNKFDRYKDGGYDQYDRSRPHDLGRSRYESSSDKYSRGGMTKKRPPYFDQSYPPYKKMRPEGPSDVRAPRGRPVRDSFPRRDFRDDRAGPSRSRGHYDHHPPSRRPGLRKYGNEGDRRPRDISPRRRSTSSRKMDEGEDRIVLKKEREPFQQPRSRSTSGYGDEKPPIKKERSPRRESVRPKEESHHERRHSRSSSKDSRRQSVHSHGDEEERSPLREFRTPTETKPRVSSSMRDVQVTIKADGMRAVNSEGFVTSTSQSLPFIDLQCPHCPDNHLITFQDYKYHLDSKEHKSKLGQLAFKHSHVLRNIRQQQRQELREMEDKWKGEDQEDFETLVTRYCDICKLAYKSPSSKTKMLGTTSTQHDETKFHKMQAHYLNPRCTLCKMEFSSRMIYEHHIASIRHLRLQSHRTGESTQEDDAPIDDDNKEELNLTDFITMDSVGEEEVGSEHDDITGRLEDVKAAEEEAKADEEEDLGEEIPFEMDVEADLNNEEDLNQPDLDKEDNKPLGMSFITPIEAVYCKLCLVAIRTDTEGAEAATEKHCRSAAHLDNYQYLDEEANEDFGEEEMVGEEIGEEEEFEGMEEEAGFDGLDEEVGFDQEEGHPFEEDERGEEPDVDEFSPGETTGEPSENNLDELDSRVACSDGQEDAEDDCEQPEQSALTNQSEEDNFEEDSNSKDEHTSRKSSV